MSTHSETMTSDHHDHDHHDHSHGADAIGWAIRLEAVSIARGLEAISLAIRSSARPILRLKGFVATAWQGPSPCRSRRWGLRLECWYEAQSQAGVRRHSLRRFELPVL